MGLFEESPESFSFVEVLGPGAVILRGFLDSQQGELLSAVNRVAAAAPFRHMVTPGGFQMSVAMTNCGRADGSRIDMAIDTIRSILNQACLGRRCRHSFSNLPRRQQHRPAFRVSSLMSA